MHDNVRYKLWRQKAKKWRRNQTARQARVDARYAERRDAQLAAWLEQAGADDALSAPRTMEIRISEVSDAPTV